MSHPLTEQGDTPFVRDMRDAGRAGMGRASTPVHRLLDAVPGSTVLLFDDGQAARLLSPFRLDGDDYLVAEVEGGMAEVNLTTLANRLVRSPHCSVCFTEVRWPSHLDAAGRCKECQP